MPSISTMQPPPAIRLTNPLIIFSKFSFAIGGKTDIVPDCTLRTYC